MPDTNKPHVYREPEDYPDEFLCPGCYQPEPRCQCFQLETEGARIEGVGPQAPTVTNDKGGKQSASPYSLVKSFPHKGVLAVAKVVKDGLDKYQPDNWRLIERWEHVNHALVHLFAYNAGDKSDAHLEHAACRLLFALETK